MESLWRLASGSTVEHFARDVYFKSNLTTEISRTIKTIHQQYVNDRRIVTESPSVSGLCDVIEAILLHGLKEKLSSRVTNVFASHSSLNERMYSIDFWPVILILCHNDVSRNIQKLKHVTTDIGRCRAWIRLSLNDGLIGSYIEALTSDTSLLNGFYRSSAYLRDKEHTDILMQLIEGLDMFVFQITYDIPSLNSWNWETLKLIGINYCESEPSPVMSAIDAMLLDGDCDKHANVVVSDHKDVETKSELKNNNEHMIVANCKEASDGDAKGPSNLHAKSEVINISGEMRHKLAFGENDDESVQINEANLSNSLNRMSGWSSVPIPIPVLKNDNIEEESYDSILQSYSTHAVLSSTPDIRDFSVSFNQYEPFPTPKHVAKAPSLFSHEPSPSESTASDFDFEVIPKSVVLNNADPDTHRFLTQLKKLANESGLDEQDYKCVSCGRPIGMIYGKSRMCHFDGHHYCLECHTNDEMIIPSRIVFNWNFRKYPIAKRNRHLLHLIDSEPLFDIKVLSPLLYKIIPEMKTVLDLRTQLFYLHAYLFTCQECIAIEMRKQVWPREHLFEHIHLFSVNDLIQVQNGVLAQTLRKVISFARKHVSSCPLCTLKGYYCEICKSSQILYPFDTESTKRCERCKTVFHLKCYVEKYEKESCPKCLRIERRESKDIK